MSTQPTTVVDALGVDPASGTLQLTLEAPQPWNWDQLVALQDRINACLAFVQSGDVFLASPEALDLDIQIDLVMTYRPTDEVMGFLQQAEAIIEDAGFLFGFGPPAGGYMGDHS